MEVLTGPAHDMPRPLEGKVTATPFLKRPPELVGHGIAPPTLPGGLIDPRVARVLAEVAGCLAPA